MVDNTVQQPEELIVPKTLHQQSVYDELSDIDLQIKNLAERKAVILADFYEKNKDLEFPVVAEDGKQKFFRVYEPDGRFVYNIKFETGLRVKAVGDTMDEARV